MVHKLNKSKQSKESQPYNDAKIKQPVNEITEIEREIMWNGERVHLYQCWDLKAEDPTV